MVTGKFKQLKNSIYTHASVAEKHNWLINYYFEAQILHWDKILSEK